MFKKMTVLILPLFIFGCSTISSDLNKPYETKVVKIEIPGYLLEKCLPEKPVEKDEFLKMNIYEREVYLTEYSVKLMKNVSECNTKLEAISDIVKTR